MHLNTGYAREALPLIRRTFDAFAPYESVVAASGSCVGSVRDQYAVAAENAGDAGLAEAGRALASRTYELSEHREAAADLAGPRSLPAAAAAVEHGQADEPVHLDVDGGDAR